MPAMPAIPVMRMLRPLPALRIEFGKPSRPLRGLLLLALGVVAVGAAASAWWETRAQLQQLRAQLHSADTRLARLRGDVARSPSVIPPAQAKAVNDVAQRLNVPWNRLFATVESLRGPGTALLSIEPNAKSGRLNILAEAKDAEAMFALYERSNAHQYLHTATLKKLEPNDKEAIPVLRFSLEAGWLDAAAAKR